MTKTASQLLVLCVLTSAGALPTFACGGGGNKPAETAAEPSENKALEEKPAPAASGSAAPAAASASAAASATPDTAPLAQVLETDAKTIQGVFDGMNAAPSAKQKENGVKGNDALAKGLREASKKLPAGMKPEGPLLTGKVAEKTHLKTDITLAPGKCYSLLGYSEKVQDLDLYLLLPPGILSGQDLTDDNKPIIGGPPNPMCPTSQTPVTYKLDIFADKGGGDVAVQLFSKGN
jgi:hypothetical protein